MRIMMKQKYKKYTQTDFAALLEIDQPRVSRVLAGKRKVPYSLAEKLADLFPGKSLREWKNSGPEELNRLFNQLEKETA